MDLNTRMRVGWGAGLLIFLAGLSLALTLGEKSHAAQADEVIHAPGDLSWQARIAPPEEPGEPLVISGVVFAPDGETPVPGITVYGYHTDAQGLYTRDGSFRTPPRLRGWAKTDAQGRFEFRTIRPAAYPNRNIPAHVHFRLWGGGYPRQWTEDLRFVGDQFVTAEAVEKSGGEGKFASIVPLVKISGGMLHCTFNIRVQRVSNFKE